MSGKVAGPSGPVAGAIVTVRNLSTGQSASARTDADGRYSLSGLAPGDSEISVSAAGFTTRSSTMTLAPGAALSQDFTLQSALSLGSLGFSAAQTQGSAAEQARLNKRSRMLQIHQKLGLITFFPLLASVATSFPAHGRKSTPAARDFHIALGSSTAGLYSATAYYALFAPKIQGVKRAGPTRFHVAMAWIHGPGMILTPVLGAMADSQINQGEKLHGVAKYHGDVALVTAVAYGLALLSETKPHWIPGLGRDVAALFAPRHHAVLSAAAPPKALPAGTVTPQVGLPGGNARF